MATGKMNGKRARAKQRDKSWDGLGGWAGQGKEVDLFVKCEDRESERESVSERERERERERETWRDMVTNR